MKPNDFYVEHFIVGTIALLVAATALPPNAELGFLEGGGWRLLTLVPLAYTAGLWIDGLGWLLEDVDRLLSGRRTRLRELFRTGRTLDDTGPSSAVDIVAWNADVAAELKLRRSRDRVARGLFFCVVGIALFMNAGHFDSKAGGLLARTPLADPWVRVPVWWGLGIVAALVWLGMHRRTRHFKRAAAANARAAEAIPPS